MRPHVAVQAILYVRGGERDFRITSERYDVIHYKVSATTQELRRPSFAHLSSPSSERWPSTNNMSAFLTHCRINAYSPALLARMILYSFIPSVSVSHLLNYREDSS
jgi:hypothetical protein